ncbi:hypothetical protein [Kitasatospora aureofaciens]|uniref:hypothetical protein n=1 Tax=Kitasatospora aureofaciens TaxID=1894 RepID=UPI001C4476C0|nr:hypothetical protein [Kitasatospora aureofaciens]MBV6695933.1 hypothetical protein [Kitasatospora aureofaciens]
MTSTASHSATPPHGRPVPGDHGGVPGGALRPAAGPDWTLPAGVGPWSVRSVGAGRGRAALEVYEHGELADVLVAARLTPQLLRGGRRSAAGGRAYQVLAWGRLAADGTAPAVAFTGGGWLRGVLRGARAAVAAEVVTVGGRFWLAWAEGPFDGVVVEHPAAGGVERLTLERVRVRRGALAAAGGAA